MNSTKVCSQAARRCHEPTSGRQKRNWSYS